jgi:hypothetical protein
METTHEPLNLAKWYLVENPIIAWVYLQFNPIITSFNEVFKYGDVAKF